MLKTSYLREKANAKLNLNFKIIKKLKNNFHEIDSLVTFLPDLYDTLYVKKSIKNKIKIIGPQAKYLKRNGGDTLVNKSIERVSELLKLKINLDVLIKKNIPINAGLGGGSADAAAIIRTIIKLYKPKKKEVIKILPEIGSDVPVCFYSKNSHVSGMGEIIKPLKLLEKKLWVLLVKPKTNYTTENIFLLFKGPFAKKHRLNYKINNIVADMNNNYNSLEQTVCKLDSKVKNILDKLHNYNNLTKPRITGSGSVIFMLFSSKNELEIYKKKVVHKISEVWTKESSIIL